LFDLLHPAIVSPYIWRLIQLRQFKVRVFLVVEMLA